MNLDQAITTYFQVLDDSLDALSLHKEGELVGLPSWVHSVRKITLGITPDGEGVLIKVTPDSNNSIEIISVNSFADATNIIAPMSYGGTPLNRLQENFFMLLGDMQLLSENPLEVPALDSRMLIGYGRKKGFLNAFSPDKAKEEAITFWNTRGGNGQKSGSYVVEIKNILYKFDAIIRRKSFLERRIHRFIREHQSILLPPHRRCLYEHIISRGGDIRKADFILEREVGLPPILIELESPVHAVLTKSFDLTKQANHAKQQISEWVSFIDSDGARNATGEYAFLSGPKERLVIIGRGTEFKDRLLEAKFDGVTIWTYDMFIETARDRLNHQYSDQCKIVGLKQATPF